MHLCILSSNFIMFGCSFNLSNALTSLYCMHSSIELNDSFNIFIATFCPVSLFLPKWTTPYDPLPKHSYNWYTYSIFIIIIFIFIHVLFHPWMYVHQVPYHLLMHLKNQNLDVPLKISLTVISFTIPILSKDLLYHDP
jgi:hypothetical protein